MMGPSIELSVVADDITGSLDTGVQFALAEFAVRVSVWPTFPETGPSQIIVMDTESRHLPAGEAGRRVEGAVRFARERNARLLYKKVDSTLRGNVGAELEATLAASGRDQIAFAPAYPRMGRTTSDGIQLVNGMPIHQSPFGRDALDPVRTSNIAEIIAAQSRLSVAVLRTPEKAKAVNARIVVLDASSDRELREAARILFPQCDRWVLAGSAGFANAISRELAELYSQRSNVRAASADGRPGIPTLAGAAQGWRGTDGDRRRVLVVNGSVNPVSAAQEDYSAERGIPLISAARHDTTISDSTAPADRMELLRRAHEGFARSDAVILTGAALSAHSGRISPDRVAAAAFADRLGQLTDAIAAHERPDALVVFGGDTLIGVMHALGISMLAPIEEIAPGVPISASVASGIPSKPWMIISKAGGFGPADLLIRILSSLGIEPGRKQVLP